MTTRIDTATRRLLPAALTAAALSLGMPALAAAGDANAVTVHYSKADLKTEAGASRVYASIERAAARACGDADGRDLRMTRAVDDCRDEAVASAVASINAPRLAALHAKQADDTRYASAASLRTSR